MYAIEQTFQNVALTKRICNLNFISEELLNLKTINNADLFV